MEMVAQVQRRLDVVSACAALGVPRASYYRWRSPRQVPALRTSHRALDRSEREAVLAVLQEPRFMDQAPAAVHAALLDEQRYLCSESTMYRVLRANRKLRERRDQLRHPQYTAPELLATAPNELWSWDITKLLGPAKWTYFYLYVILDVLSRYVVGWMIAHRESATLAKRLIKASCDRQGILPDQLTIHADRGSSMTSKTVALLLSDLGITKTHSRPHVSNDNPFSESQFKTLKYRPEFPARFGCIQDARSLCGDLLRWYNHEHYHSGLGMLTPYEVHHGLAGETLAKRAHVLELAYAAHPERFVRGVSRPATPPKEVWINKPKQSFDESANRVETREPAKICARGCPRSDDPGVSLPRTTPESSTPELSEALL